MGARMKELNEFDLELDRVITEAASEGSTEISLLICRSRENDTESARMIAYGVPCPTGRNMKTFCSWMAKQDTIGIACCLQKHLKTKGFTRVASKVQAATLRETREMLTVSWA